MAAMAYSMIPQEVSIGITSDTLDGTNTMYFVPLSSLEGIAEVMGDGWYAEEITSTSELTIQFRQTSYVRNLAIGKYLPVLRHARYHLVFSFLYSGANKNNLTASITNIDDGTLLNWSTITNINAQISSLDVFSFNSTTKALCGVADRNLNTSSALVFAANGVLMPHQIMDNGSTTALGIALNDGSYSSVTYNNTLTGNPKTIFEPVFSNVSVQTEFNGLYVEVRANDMQQKTVTYGGITYKIFGNNSNWAGMNRPKICVSSEILG